MYRLPCAAIKSSVPTSWTYLTSFMKTDSKTTTVVGSCRIWVQAGREWFESCLRSRSVAGRNHYTECRQSNHGNEYVKCFIWNKQNSGVQRARVFKSMFFFFTRDWDKRISQWKAIPHFHFAHNTTCLPTNFCIVIDHCLLFHFPEVPKKLESNKVKWETHFSRMHKNST